MRNYLLTCFIVLTAMAAMAQQKGSTIHLVKSSSGVYAKVNGIDVEKVYNGTFQQKYSTLSADSAYVNLKDNTFDAFGHVVINQGDTLHIYSDKLNYNDNTKVAILTNNVRMVDKDATLTTNDFTYNTATRIGTYINGGKLVNKGNVLVSKNGYYYAIPRDAFFRYDVKLTTTDANIVTDTLRYNSGSRIAYFLGPTNIYGKKDKDTLYTENGLYNTITEQAAFGKRNLYRNGTKSLKGDSLFYDRLKGYGRAVKRVTFEDKEQKMVIKGDLGEYYKKQERAVITQNAYTILITEERDTSKAPPANVSQADTARKLPGLKKSGVKQLPAVKNTAPLAGGVPLPPGVKTDTLIKVAQQRAKQVPQEVSSVVNKLPVDTAALRNPATQALAKLPVNKINTNPSALASTITSVAAPAGKDSVRMRRDSMYIGADTLETQMLTYKEQKDLQEKMRLAGIRDTSIKARKPFVPYKTMPKAIAATLPKFMPEKRSFVSDLFPRPKRTADTSVKKQPAAAIARRRLTHADSLKIKSDSLLAIKIKASQLSDTAHVRILTAHHNVKIFKSDLQAKSDSLFYSSSDSIIRSFIKPIVWAQGSQLSGDTIYLQLKNKKLDNMDVFPNAFAVNVEKGDSTHFNQLGGKRMKGYFKDNKLSQLNVDGNAENVYFIRDKGKITDMHRSVSSAIRVYMAKGEVIHSTFVKKVEHKYTPIKAVKDDDEILKGFIWKPEERPVSKDDILHPRKKKPQPATQSPAKIADKKLGVMPVTGDKKAATLSTTKADSTSSKQPTMKQPLTTKKDSVNKKVDILKKVTVKPVKP